MKNKDKITKWQEELKEITKKFQVILLNKDIIWKEILSNQKISDKNNIFFQLMASNYVAYMVLELCKLADENKESVSLVNILNDILNSPKIITRSWFVSCYKMPAIDEKNKIKFANNDFDKFSTKNSEYIKVSEICKDICILKCGLLEIKKLRNKKIAHFDKRKSNVKLQVSFNDLHKSISLCEKLLIKYHKLLFQKAPLSFLPTVQQGWKKGLIKLQKII